MPKTITCPYCGTTKKVRNDAETCGSGACRVKKSREMKKQRESGLFMQTQDFSSSTAHNNNEVA